EGTNRIGTRRVRKGAEGEGDEGIGTYAISGRVDNLLGRMQGGKLIIHIDLDYFVNDYDGGNIQDMSREQEAAAVRNAETKLRQFFQGMRSLERPVDRWIVATSPGFCAARHWNWLTDKILAGIEQLRAYQGVEKR